MRIPQTAERIKEAPAQALRAVFAGVGQVLLITERVRRRGGSDSQATEVASEATGAPQAAAVVPEARVAPEAAETDAVKAETVQADAAKPETVQAETAEATAAAGAEGTSVLPVPHYSELTIASLRARLRGLDVGQIRDLITYERSHEDRENVIAMFERRIAKLEEAGGADTAKG